MPGQPPDPSGAPEPSVSTGKPSSTPPISYAQITANGSASSFQAGSLRATTFKGEPSIIIPAEAEQILAAGFQRSLVGKFSQGRPLLDTIKKFLSVQNYKGNYTLGLLDNKHVLIRFHHDEDYIRLFSKPSWQVGNKNMRIFKWTVDFHVDKEPPIVPVWISLPKLPVHFQNKDFIFGLMQSVGKPLRIDAATAELRRPSLARVQVEVDVLKNIPSRIWIQKENGDGFWQPILPEGSRPAYCTHCWHMGHNQDFCLVKHPDLATKNPPPTSKTTQVYVAKNTTTQPTQDTVVVNAGDKNLDKSSSSNLQNGTAAPQANKTTLASIQAMQNVTDTPSLNITNEDIMTTLIETTEDKFQRQRLIRHFDTHGYGSDSEKHRAKVQQNVNILEWVPPIRAHGDSDSEDMQSQEDTQDTDTEENVIKTTPEMDTESPFIPVTKGRKNKQHASKSTGVQTRAIKQPKRRFPNE